MWLKKHMKSWKDQPPIATKVVEQSQSYSQLSFNQRANMKVTQVATYVERRKFHKKVLVDIGVVKYIWEYEDLFEDATNMLCCHFDSLSFGFILTQLSTSFLICQGLALRNCATALPQHSSSLYSSLIAWALSLKAALM
jgi:hypothetical protein